MGSATDPIDALAPDECVCRWLDGCVCPPAERANDADRHIANGVLDAWTDYCRDKGLL